MHSVHVGQRKPPQTKLHTKTTTTTTNGGGPVVFSRRVSPPSSTKLTNKTPACPSASWSLILQGSTSSLIPYYRGYVKCKHLTLTHFQEEPPPPLPERGGGVKGGGGPVDKPQAAIGVLFSFLFFVFTSHKLVGILCSHQAGKCRGE